MTSDATRYVWCVTRSGQIAGRTFRKPLTDPSWWQRVLGRRFERGTYFELERLRLEPALKALDLYLRSPRSFAIDTEQGCHIDVLYRRGQTEAYLDIWFGEADFEDFYIAVDALPRLVTAIYHTDSDTEIAEYLHTVATPASA